MTKANFFIIGAAKSGTTSLAAFLESLPEVYLSPIKEPCHFCPDINRQLHDEMKRQQVMDTNKYFEQNMPMPMHIAHVNDVNKYARLFSEAGDATILGECSTYYMPSEVSAEKIYVYNPDAKIVAVLRDPVSRIRSHHKMNVRMGLEHRSIEECIQEEIGLGDSACFSNCRMYLAMSDYEPQIARFQKYFGPDQLKIIRFEDLQDSPETVLADLLGFLGLDGEGVILKLPRENVGDHAPRFKALDRLLYKTGLQRFLRYHFKRLLPRRTFLWVKSLYSSSKVSETSAEEVWPSYPQVELLSAKFLICTT